MRTILLFCGVLLLSDQWELQAQSLPIDVVITSRDGVRLRGSYFSPQAPGPGVLLFHQCNMDRHAWNSLARDLMRDGMHVLTFDARGIGESGRGRVTPENVAGDGDAAYNWLVAQTQVTAVAVGGASCGVTQAVNLAMRHRDIRALVLLSGGVASAGLAFLNGTTSPPIFASAAERDPQGNAVAAAGRASKNSNSVLRLYSGSTHGVDLFTREGDLRPAIVSWLRERLTQ